MQQKLNIKQLVVKNLIVEDVEYNIPKSGCYVKNLDILQAFNMPIAVPLKQIDYNIKIIQNVARITIEQEYVNPLDTFLELQYSFPIRENICIHSFKAIFDENEIIGKIKAKEVAKQQYEKGLKEGKQVVYGELDEKTKEFMNMKIGNVSPRSSVKINIQFIQQLEVELNIFWKLILPSLVSPRYQNQSIVVNKSHVPDAVWSFKVELNTTKKCLYSDSSSHKINLLSQTDNESLFVMEKSQKPNRDFIFMFTTVEFDHPHCIRGQTDTSQTLMLSFIPKFHELSLDDAQKMAVAKKDYDVNMENVRSEYIFLLDRSGSMSGLRIQKAKQALIYFIKSLPQNSYFNIYSFGSGFNKLFIKNQKYSDKTANQSISKIQKFSADMGGTQIYQPLVQVFKSQLIQGYPKQVFLLTDGGVSNTSGVLTLIKKNNKYCRVHSIGIGNGASEELIIKSAQNGKGNHTFINDKQNVSAKIVDLLEKSLSPVLTNFKLQFDQSKVQSITPNPAKMPYILKNDAINLFVILKPEVKQSIKFKLEYIDSIKNQQYSHQLESDPHQIAYDFVDKMAHYKQINILCESIKDNKQAKEDIYISQKEDLKSYIISQSVRHQVLCEYTSYICEGKDLKDQRYQQYKKIGLQKYQEERIIKQCSYQPISMSMPMSMPIQNFSTQKFRTLTDQSKSFSRRAQPEREQLKMAYNLSYEPKAMKKSSGFLSSGGGFLSSVSNFFGGMFSKDSKKKQSFPQPQKQSQNLDLFDLKQCCYMQSLSMKQSQSNPIQSKIQIKEEEQKSKKKVVEKVEVKEIKSLIKSQKSDGSWDQQNFDQICQLLKIIPSIFSQLINNGVSRQFILTFIVLEYLKELNSSQYSLIIKKADNWIKKTTKEANISNDKIVELRKLIKP